MIDLHTHTLLSDGALLPTELVRRCEAKRYKAVALTDHVDGSNIDFVVPRTVEICKELNKRWEITVIPGAELTHLPPEDFSEAIEYARSRGIKLILVHGETIVEPVIEGTNAKALESDIDILAHPGLLTSESARIAAKNNIYLEITTRRGHSLTNGWVAKVAKTAGARLILNTDTHSPEDLISQEEAQAVAQGAGLSEDEIRSLFGNSREIVERMRIKKDTSSHR